MPQNNLNGLKLELTKAAERAVDAASVALENQIRTNINPPGGASLEELRAAGYPLHPNRFSRTKAGLNKDYEIIRQTGGLNAFLGRDRIRVDSWGAETHVGFDNTGTHTGHYKPYGNPKANLRRRSVDINDLLSWLLDGTAKIVGRPVLINSLADALDAMHRAVAVTGLRPIKLSQARRKAVVRK